MAASPKINFGKSGLGDLLNFVTDLATGMIKKEVNTTLCSGADALIDGALSAGLSNLTKKLLPYMQVFMFSPGSPRSSSFSFVARNK